ncbi:MAG: DUF3830 family protein [Parvibaculaceae bacterium]
MNPVQIQIANHRLVARFEHQLTPRTCHWFRQMLPFKGKLIHVRWSGEACWVPLGNDDIPVGYENATSQPAPGEILIYTGNKSEREILLPCGGASFSSKVGPLAGNHTMTVVEGLDLLRTIERLVLWEGAQDITFE